MDCKTARFLLAFAHPTGRELLGDEATDLEAHLAQCSECAQLAQHEKQLYAWMAPAVQAVPIPHDLKSRILARLARPAPRIRRRWQCPLALGLAAAVALFAVIWFFVDWQARHKPAANTDELLQQVRYLNSAQAAEEWFQTAHNVHIIAPEKFDYQYLVACKMEPHHNQQIPVLIFCRPKDDKFEFAIAWVFVFSDKDFNLSKLPDEVPSGSDHTVQRLPSTNPESHFAYVAVFTGPTIEAFYTRSSETGTVALNWP